MARARPPAEDPWVSLQARFDAASVLLLTSEDARPLVALFARAARVAPRKTLLLSGAEHECATLLRQEGQAAGLCVLPLAVLYRPDMLPVRLDKLTSLFVHRVDLQQEDCQKVFEILAGLSPEVKFAASLPRERLASVKAAIAAVPALRARDVASHTPPAPAKTDKPIVAKREEFLELDGNKVVVKGAHARFEEATAVVAQIAETRDCKVDDENDPDADNLAALRTLFAQIPGALARPQLDMLPGPRADMTLLEWFAETFRIDDASFVNQQLPVVVPSSRNTAQEVAEMNDMATEQLVAIGAEKHVFVEAVEASPQLRERPARWALMSAVAPPVLKLAVGMPVLLLHTLRGATQAQTLEQGLVGRVLAFENGRRPIVSFYGTEQTGHERTVLALEPVAFRPTLGLSLASPVWARVKQFPLAPAFFLHETLTQSIPLRSAWCQWT
jgi:hypothetical protein